MGEDLDRRARRRAIAAVVILAAGVVVAVAAPMVGGDEFLRSWESGRPTVRRFGLHHDLIDPRYLPSESLFGLVASDPRWLAATVSLVAVPLWFLWWRRSAMSFARGLGVLASAATTAALVALTWHAYEFCAAHVLIAAPVAYFVAFLVAPPHLEAS